MIICPTHGIVFVHIPKCAGTAVRSQISRCDPAMVEMARLMTHPVLGRIDAGHVPLHHLRDHFPEPWAALQEMDSFAVLRDPVDRFGSALRQILWQYDDHRPMTLIPPEELRDRALALLPEIAAQIPAPSHKMIFFARQKSFTHLDDRQVVRHLVPLGLVPDFIAHLSRRTGMAMDTGARANQNVDLRFKGLGQLPFQINAFLRARLPRGLHARIKGAALGVLASKNSAARESGLLDLPEIRDFVAEHYAEDIALYRAALEDRLRLRAWLQAAPEAAPQIQAGAAG